MDLIEHLSDELV